MVGELFIEQFEQLIEQKRRRNNGRTRIMAITTALKHLRPATEAVQTLH